MSVRKNVDTNAKEDDTMSVYVKPIQATPTLSGSDAISIVKQSLIVPSKESVEKNKRLLEIRKQHEKK